VVEDTDVIVAQILCGLDKIVDDAEVCTDFDCGKSNADLHVVYSLEKSTHDEKVCLENCDATVQVSL
jgi:hypothetical protein